MQLPGNGHGFCSREADFTPEPGFHLVGHGEGQRGQQHGPVGLGVERLRLPGLGAVRPGSSLPAPLQDRGSRGAVVADGAVQADQLALRGRRHAADDGSLGGV